MPLHFETLTDEAKKIFPKLRGFPDFYLAGGTALALQIGHRVSVDFDFFSGEKIKKTLLAKTEEIFSDCKKEILVNNSSELTFLANGVKITFLEYPFPVLLPMVFEDGIHFLSAEEIGATKAYTIGRRGELKDYYDVYSLLQERRVSLFEISELAEKKYGEAFDIRLFFEQLLYLDDIEETKLVLLKAKDIVDKKKLREFFEAEIGKIPV